MILKYLFAMFVVLMPDTGTVTMTIQGQNDPPVAADDTFTVEENGLLTGNVMDNDYDVDVNDITIVVKVNGEIFEPGDELVLPSGAILKIQADGNFEYNPNNQFEELGVGDTATDKFTYEIINPLS